MIWSLLLVFAAPILGILLLWFSPFGEHSPRLLAKVIAGVSLVGAFFAMVFHSPQMVVPFWSWLGLGSDGFSILLMVMYTFFFFLLIVLCPMSLSYLQEVSSIFLVELGLVIVLLSTHLITYFFGCILIAIPLFLKFYTKQQMRREAIFYLLYQSVGILLLALAFLSLYFDMPRGLRKDFFDIPFLVKSLHDLQISLRTSFLFAIAILYRLGVWPFHVPLLIIFQRARYGGLIAYILGHIAVTSMLKFGGILLTNTLKPLLVPILLILFLNALYFSLVSLAQQQLRRLLAYQCFSFLALGMTLMITPTAHHFLNCKIEVVTLSLVFGGLMSALWLVESHIDIDHIAQYQGLAKRSSVLAVFFLIIVLTAIGFPGTIGYIAEELVLQNRFHRGLWEGLFALVIVFLNAWILFRCYARLFLGPASDDSGLSVPLRLRENLVLLCIVVFIVWSGLMPDLFFRIR